MTLRASRKRQGDVSLQDPISTDGEGNDITFMDILGTDQDALEEEVIRKVTLERVRRVLRLLPARERLVLEMRYGLNGEEPVTQKEVGLRLHVSRSYVSRIEKKALEKLVEAAKLREEM
ncbi:MAG: sigma-70 family RNA polymerase sigma factor [Aristaeellaceae bacterium]